MQPNPTRPAMIDLDIHVHVGDRHRSFQLTAQIKSDAQLIALYGPSGSGKSLTLQTIAGLIRPTVGHVRLAGRTLVDTAQDTFLSARERHLGYLFQDYALFPHLSVRENVGFGLTSWLKRRPSTAEKEHIDDLLQRFDLSSLASSRPSTLSGGQKQRVALARALATQPKALLLDEPFSALNPMLRASMREELARVQAQWQIPVIMITHDIEDVLTLAQETFVFGQGKILRAIDMKTAESHELLQQPESAAAHMDPALRSRLTQLLHSN